jgi:hypothetical protein
MRFPPKKKVQEVESTSSETSGDTWTQKPHGTHTQGGPQKPAWEAPKKKIAPIPATAEARAALLSKIDAFTKADVPLEALRVVSEGPVTKAVHLFIAGELKLNDECDYLSKVPDERVVPRALNKAADFMPDATYPCAFSYYVEVALVHGPTVQASFAHVLNSLRYNMDRLPEGVTQAKIVECISRLKKHNVKSKRRRKDQRRADKATAAPQEKYGAAAGTKRKTEKPVKVNFEFESEGTPATPKSKRLKTTTTWEVATPNSSALM